MITAHFQKKNLQSINFSLVLDIVQEGIYHFLLICQDIFTTEITNLLMGNVFNKIFCCEFMWMYVKQFFCTYHTSYVYIFSFGICFRYFADFAFIVLFIV